MNFIEPKEFLSRVPRDYHNLSSLGPYTTPFFGMMYFGRIKTIIHLVKKLDREFSETLEVGGGFGLFSVNFKDQFPKANHTLVDLMPIYVEEVVKDVINNKYNLDMEFKFECDIQEKIPFEDNHFDLIFALDVLEHVEDAELALDQIFRITKPGGLIFISVPTESILLVWIRKLYSKMKTIETEPHWNGILKSEKDFYRVLVKRNVNFLLKRKHPFRFLPRFLSYDMFYAIQK